MVDRLREELCAVRIPGTFLEVVKDESLGSSAQDRVRRAGAFLGQGINFRPTVGGRRLVLSMEDSKELYDRNRNELLSYKALLQGAICHVQDGTASS